MSSEDSYVMYLVVNQDLKMSPGKLGAQIGHAVQHICEQYAYYSAALELNPTPIDPHRMSAYQKWKKDNVGKIVLRAKGSEWEKVKEAADHVVRDAGHTELEPGSETVAVFWPMAKSNRHKLLKRLQLL